MIIGDTVIGPLVARPNSREIILAEALSWKGTPYRKKGRLKGAGADCFTFIAGVMIACGLMTPEQLPPYRDDWFLHATEQHYVKLLMRHASEILTAQASATLAVEPGNIVVTCVRSKIFNHGAIVTDWPRALHCVKGFGVSECNISTHPMWAGHEIKIFDPLRADVR